MCDKKQIEIKESNPKSPELRKLLNELSEALLQITGDDGTSSFYEQEYASPRSLFLILFYNQVPSACGSIRTLTEDTCEIKRMYSKVAGKGFGKMILKALEEAAKSLEYKEIWASTRKVNTNAVDFYLSQQYVVRENYGKYKSNSESICFSKAL